MPDLTDMSEYIDKKVMSFLPEPDYSAASNKCELLRVGKENISELDQADLKEFVELTAWLDIKQLRANGGYQYKDIADHAIATSPGVRTCEAIGRATGNKWCDTCQFNGQVKSPYLLQFLEEQDIPTQETGFYTMKQTKKGLVRDKPCYDDLVKYYASKYPFKVMCDSEIIYTWNGKYWSETFPLEVKHFAEKNFVPSPSTHMCNEFYNKLCRSNLHQPSWFAESTQGKINLQNGMFDIAEGQLKEHSQEVGFRYSLPYEYHEGADCPRFDQFLWEITCGDDNLQKILLEFMGYCLSGDEYWCHKALFLFGEGANGKSTFLQVLMNLVGNENYAAQSLGELNFAQNRYDIDGKLFNVSEEAGVDSISQSEIFKRMVGGNEISVKKLYSQPYTIRNNCKLIISCNDLPKSGDKTHGLYRRMLIVPFNAKFEGSERDVNIQHKLNKELPGIFNKAVAAYKEFAARGYFTQSAAVEEQLINYEEQNDNVIYWKNERVDSILPADERFQSVFTPKDDLYKDYKEFTQENMQRPLSKIQFFIRFAKLFPFNPIERRRTQLDKRPRVIMGITLRDDDN